MDDRVAATFMGLFIDFQRPTVAACVSAAMKCFRRKAGVKPASRCDESLPLLLVPPPHPLSSKSFIRTEWKEGKQRC